MKYLAVLFLGVASVSFAVKPYPVNLVTEDFPPFQYLQDDQPVGPMVEVMQAVCKEAKVECTITLMPWQQALFQAEAGIADGIFSVGYSTSRLEHFHMSDAIVSSSYGFYTRHGTEWIYTNPADLEGMTVKVYGPSGTATALEEITTPIDSVSVVMSAKNEVILAELNASKEGGRNAVAINSDVGLWLIKKHKLTKLKFSGDYKSLTYGFGISKRSHNADHFGKLNKALKELQSRGVIFEILKRHWLVPVKKTELHK